MIFYVKKLFPPAPSEREIMLGDMEPKLLEKIRAELAVAKRVVFLGGAGVSVASGIPDFRSPNGLYSQKRADGMSYEELLSHHYFMQDPKGFYDFYWHGMVNPSAKPNKAHLALARYEENHNLAILTQNIDGLHSLAGSHRVYELHGSVQRYRCMKCGKAFALGDLKPEGVPICDRCGGIIKPDVVLYEEGLPYDDLEAGIDAVSKADVMIVGGTSLRVYPFAAIPQYFRGRFSLLINNEATPLDREFDAVVHEDIGDTLEAILQ